MTRRNMSAFELENAVLKAVFQVPDDVAGVSIAHIARTVGVQPSSHLRKVIKRLVEQGEFYEYKQSYMGGVCPYRFWYSANKWATLFDMTTLGGA